MQVLIHNSLFFHQRYGGVSRYSSCLSKGLIDKEINLSLIAPIFKNKYIKNIQKLKIHGIYISRYPNLKILRKINDNLVDYYKDSLKADIIHDTYYPTNYNRNSKKKILTIHDTIHEKFSNIYKIDYIDIRKKLIKNIDLFICVSQNTRNDFIEYYNIPNDRVFVIPHGHEHLTDTVSFDISNEKITNKPFILYVGGRLRYKNFKVLIEAYSKIKEIKNNYNIVCYGGEKITKEELTFFRKLGIEKNIIKIDGSDSLLKSLYKNSKLLVSTSLYEGYGLNILEAISADCPILVNNINVYKDIYKDSINYYDYNNLDHLVNKLQEILINNKYIINKEHTVNVLKENNWKKCADSTIDLYKKIN